MIYQELNLIPKLTVAENIFIGNEPKNGPFIDKRRMKVRAKELLDRYKDRLTGSEGSD